MNFYSIKELHNLLLTKKTTPSKIVKDAFIKLEKYKILNATVTELKLEAINLAKKLDNIAIKKNNYLFSLPYFAKDNFSTEKIKTTASSKILENFIPNYESTVTNIFKKNNSILLGKSVLDELGMGGHGLYALTWDVLNPWDLTRITGGSSSGSAALVSAGVVPFALGTDTGDSIRKPAGYCGIVGFKPTYGLISRYGVFPYAPSLDTVGYFTRTVEDSAIIFDYLAKKDYNDSTSLKSKEKKYFKNLSIDKAKKQKFSYLKNAHLILSDEIRNKFDDLYNKLNDMGISVTAIEFPENLLKALMPVYMVISFAEAVSSHSMLNGINFGTQIDGNTYEEVIINSRTNGFGKIVKRRHIIGSYVLRKENQKFLFLKAKKVRRLIVEALKIVFKKYDFLLLPASSSIAPKIKDIKNKILKESKLENYIDDLLLLGNLMGSPSLTIPFDFFEKMPIGININSLPFCDQNVFNAGLLIEKIVGIKNIVNLKGVNNNI